MTFQAPSRGRTAGVVAGLAIATAPAALVAPAVAAVKPLNVNCRGGANSCSAVIGLAGGASNRTVKVTLTDTNLKLVGIVAKPSEIRGAYLLSNGKHSLGGSAFTFTLNAVKSIGKGATLTLKFSAKGKAIKLKG